MSLLITSGGVVTVGGGVPRRIESGITWDHDGMNVDSFVLDIDGTEYDLGALSPVTSTTYNVAWPGAVASGSHTVTVWAVNENGRSASLSATLVKP